MFITNPAVFAERFNEKFDDSYRKITSDDVRIMIDCGLVKRYGYFCRQDLETVRAVLQYEQRRQLVLPEKMTGDKLSPPRCKRCGQLLPDPPPGKKGRHGEYCPDCEPERSRERNRKWRKKKLLV